MSLQGSIHKWTDGIGYGAFIPTDRAYYSINTPDARTRPSSEMIEAYHGQNITAGIATHRTDISYGRTTQSVERGTPGDSRARQAARSLTSGEVGGFCWPDDLAKARHGDVPTILAAAAASAEAAASCASVVPPTPRCRVLTTRRQTLTHQPQAAEQGRIDAGPEMGRQLRRDLTSRSSTSSNSSSSSSTRRYCSASVRSSTIPTTPSSERRREDMISSDRDNHGDRSNNLYGSIERNKSPPSEQNAPQEGRKDNRRRARQTTGKDDDLVSAEKIPKPSKPPVPAYGKLDPVFERHRKYDLIAAERAARGGDVTGRFGLVDGAAVSAASLLTSELSAPWSHMLRGQKW